jgi:hypothetical protein
MRMREFRVPAVLVAGGMLMSLAAVAADQTQIGGGNVRAEQIGHHSYPGGLAVHESFNDQSAINFADT